MRHLIFLSLLIIFALSCNSSKQSYTLNGTWIPTKQEMGGAELPHSTFKIEVLVLTDSNYVFTAESVDKGIVKYTDNKMDVYGKDGVNSGKHFAAIYKVENNVLTVCYNLAGDKYPDAYETKSNPMYFLSVYKKK
ncbi:MAG: hypothetical protein HY064_16435 [Bacteroidetes bacterium]|nr:hypothetical protein [Bacteroidota bacterium]